MELRGGDEILERQSHLHFSLHLRQRASMVLFFFPKSYVIFYLFFHSFMYYFFKKFFLNLKKFFIYFYLFIFGRVGSSLMRAGFL